MTISDLARPVNIAQLRERCGVKYSERDRTEGGAAAIETLLKNGQWVMQTHPDSIAVISRRMDALVIHVDLAIDGRPYKVSIRPLTEVVITPAAVRLWLKRRQEAGK